MGARFFERCFFVTSILFLAFSLYYVKDDDLLLATNEDRMHQKQTSDALARWIHSLPSIFDLKTNVIASDFREPPTIPLPCSMERCFNFSKCRQRPYRHYVYPIDDRVKMSPSYRKILNVLQRSQDYTDDPTEACLFILSLDTLDRDKLSEEHYVRNMQSRLESLELWNNGENHIIFNLYSGTYPDYTESLDFDIGNAILAKASSSDSHYRIGFDVSIPLFHAHHPEKGGESGQVQSNALPVRKRHFLAFKGKRYVYGIGSETRNSLYHLHNGADVILLTTCKHGKNWQELKDERCDEDNLAYDKWDYNTLLTNSTFCMVPRGRRLGSFRFIETLQSGCVPIVLSNEWKLPFFELIDYNAAVVNADERLLMQVPDTLRSIAESRIHSMRQQTQVLWNRYFSSIETIISNALKIVHERIHLHLSKPNVFWNIQESRLMTERWILNNAYSNEKKNDCIVVITVTETFDSSNSMNLIRLLRAVSFSKFVSKIELVWASGTPPKLSYFQKVAKNVPVELIKTDASEVSHILLGRPTEYFSSNAVLFLDFDSTVITDEIDFLFSVWSHNPERLVGITSRSHYWDSSKKTWKYTSKWINHYSMVLLNGAIMSRFYFDLFKQLSPEIWNTLETNSGCADILVNFAISDLTKKGPIKVTLRKEAVGGFSMKRSKYNSEHHAQFLEKSNCISSLVNAFGKNPLRKTSYRIDPVLYKDTVSNARKKYRKLEPLTALGGMQS